MSTDSITRFHFPMVRFNGHQKNLWNPILRKQYKQRPEERVRLQVVEALLSLGISRARIAFEHLVHLPRDKSSSRTDILVFDKAVEPLLLVECKEPRVQLSEQTALQFARYNEALKAPYGLLTNGIRDIWISYKDGTSSIHEEPPHQLFSIPSAVPNKQPYPYWRERGFLGYNHPISFEERISVMLSGWFFDTSLRPPVYLNFPELPVRFSFDGYYAIPFREDGHQLGITFSAAGKNETVLNAILNEQGINTRLLSVPVTSSGVSTLFTKAGTQELEISMEELLSASDVAEHVFQFMK